MQTYICGKRTPERRLTTGFRGYHKIDYILCFVYPGGTVAHTGRRIARKRIGHLSSIRTDTDGGQGHRNNEPRRDGVARNERKKTANAATNESAAAGSSIEAADGESIRSVIETTTPITKINATRSPFCRGLNWQLGQAVTLPSSSSCPHRSQQGLPSINGITSPLRVRRC